MSLKEFAVLFEEMDGKIESLKDGIGKDSAEEAIAFFKQEVVPTTGIFPKIFTCPVCSKKLKAPRSGRFRCSECKTILAVDSNGQVFLG